MVEVVDTAVVEARVATAVEDTSRVVAAEATVAARVDTAAEARPAMAAEATSRVVVVAATAAREDTAEAEATKDHSPPCHPPFNPISLLFSSSPVSENPMVTRFLLYLSSSCPLVLLVCPHTLPACSRSSCPMP